MSEARRAAVHFHEVLEREPGNAAALHAGPAVLWSYVITGIVCAFAGLCYAELASTLPVSGWGYSYS